MTQKFNHGEVWLANLNPSKGAEPGKTRPVLIVQEQALLDVEHPSTIIIPITSQIYDDVFPLRVRLKASEKLKKESDLLIDQIRAIDNCRFSGESPLVTLSETSMRKIYQAISEVMGLEL